MSTKDIDMSSANESNSVHIGMSSPKKSINLSQSADTVNSDNLTRFSGSKERSKSLFSLSFKKDKEKSSSSSIGSPGDKVKLSPRGNKSLSPRENRSVSPRENTKMSPRDNMKKIYNRAKNFVVKSFDGEKKDVNSPPPTEKNIERVINTKRMGVKFERRITQDKLSVDNINEKLKSDWDTHVGHILEEKTDCIRYIENDKGEKTLYAATLNELIKYLTNPNQIDTDFSKIFLLTYRTFATPSILLQKLFEIYEQKNDDILARKIKLKCLNVIVAWIDDSFNDFDEEMIGKLKKFIDDVKVENHFFSEKIHKSLSLQMVGIIQKKVFQFLEGAPTPKIPRDINNLSFNNICPLELARQITLYDYECFSSIKPTEFLNQSWNNPKLKHNAPNILKMIYRFNSLSKWTTSVILSEKNLKNRKNIFTKFIDIASCLYNMRNLSGVISIISGLDNTAVFRLKYTKEKTKESSLQTYEELRQLYDPNSSFKNYRENLSKSIPPCVPHIGLLLSDLTFIEEGNPDIIDNKLINLHKRRLISNNILTYNFFQSTPFNFHKVEPIHDFIKKETEKAENLSDDELYQISLILEPRGWDGISMDSISNSF